MNYTLITFSVLTSLGVAAGVTSFSSEPLNAQEIDRATKTGQAVTDTVENDCSDQTWPNFSPSCLRGHNTRVTVRNVNLVASQRR